MVGVVVVLVAGGIVVEGSILSAPRTRSLPPPQHTPAAATLAGTLTDPGGESVGAIAFGDNGTTLTTADADGSAYVWNTRTRGADELATYDGQSVAVWNLTTQQRIGTVSSSDCPCALGPGGTEIAATYSSIERLAVISDVSAGTIEGTFAGEGTTSHLATLALSADGELLAVNYVDHRTYLFDIQANRDLGALTGSGSEGTNEMVFSADGTTLATGDKNGSTYVWNVATHHLIAALPDPDRAAIELVALSPDGKLLATSGGSGRVYLWNVSRHKIIATVPAPGQETPFCAAFSPSGTTLAVTGNDKTYLYNLHT
jgi:WD40 repeat protein